MTNGEIEKIKEQMCDEYCALPGFFSAEDLAERCDNCPLNRLEADETT